MNYPKKHPLMFDDKRTVSFVQEIYSVALLTWES